MTERNHAVPRDCRGTPAEEFKPKAFTEADAKDLRHQMYLYLINYGFCKDKEQAKDLLKKHGFLMKQQLVKKVKVVPEDIKAKAEAYDMLKTFMKN